MFGLNDDDNVLDLPPKLVSPLGLYSLKNLLLEILNSKLIQVARCFILGPGKHLVDTH